MKLSTYINLVFFVAFILVMVQCALAAYMVVCPTARSTPILSVPGVECPLPEKSAGREP